MNIKDVPQPLYKYRQWNELCVDQQYQKKILTENEVYLSSANQFNDPFDAAIPFRFKPEQMTPVNIFSKLHQIGRSLEPKISEEELLQKCYNQQYSGHFENGSYWRASYEEDIKAYNTFGILSLTSKMNNLLMWSHYANSHRGFCVGLDKYKLREALEGTLEPINYSEEVPYIDLFKNDQEDRTNLLLTKSSEWKYEDEYRLIKSFSSRTAYKLPNDAILEIYLGLKMPEVEREEIVKLAKVKFPKAKLFQSTVLLERFELFMAPIL